ncbi:MAG: translocation/assembly module TamB domain-containing protein [Candidatus Velthaea sp.]
MKTDGRNRPDAGVRVSPSASAGPSGRRPGSRRLAIVAALACLFAVAAFVARHAIVGAVLKTGVAFATGDRVRIGSFHLGWTASVVTGLDVRTRTDDPLLEARRVVLRYSLPDLITQRARRFGLSALSADGFVFTLVRHADGTYNVGSGSGAGGTGASGSDRAPGVPWDLALQVRDGEIRLVDRGPVLGDLAEQRIVGLAVDGRLRSAGRSDFHGGARLIGRQTQTAAVQAWPIALDGMVDVPRGAANVRVAAPELPVRGALGFLQHSSAVRVDDGLLHALEIRIYALDIAPHQPLELHVGGQADLTSGRLAIAALRKPVRDMRGRITLTDDGVWATRLDATIGRFPVVARGGAFDRLHPTLRLGLRADADLDALRELFAFSQHQPVRGAAHVETLLEAPVANLLIRSALRIPHGSYARSPLSDVTGRVDYHAGSVVLDGVRGRYGAATLGVGARFLLGGPALDSAVVASASAPGRSIPYAENVAPEASVDALALITGGADGYRARGALGLASADVTGNGMFAIDERGVGEFGPFALARRDGSSLIGALRLERPTSQSAAWISARAYRVAVPSIAARFPGLSVPAFPPVAGVIDGEVAGGGPSDRFGLTGELRGRDLRVAGARLGRGRARLGGNLADLRLEMLETDGPVGRFRGTAAVSSSAFALRGAYDGSLDRLVPFTGRQQAHGAVRGEVRATVDGGDVVVQSPGARLQNGSVRGVALDSAAGTIAVHGRTFHLITATGSVGGRHAVAAESAGRVAVSAPDLPSAAFRGTGLPLDAGKVSAYGVADLRGRSPRFAGTLAVTDGRAHGYRIAGDARIDFAGSLARIAGATGALGSTYGRLDGSIDGIGAGALRYDVAARVPFGDIDLLRRDLNLPARNLAGTFDADLHVHGTGARPFVEGLVRAPEGRYNGLAFRAAAAQIVLDGDGVAARDGTITVGSTTATVAASVDRGAFDLSAHAAAADLADFNDFFDASDTLAGRGPIGFSVGTAGRRLTSSGQFDLQGLRYRTFALGRANAQWRTRGGTIAGQASVENAAGKFDATMAVTPAGGSDLRRAFAAANYDARATFAGIELGTWLPAFGSSAPVAGRLDARIGVRGRLPQLAADIDATLAGAVVNGFAVNAAHLRAQSRGSIVEVRSADADLGFAQLAGNGKLGLSSTDPLAFDLRVTSDDVGIAARAFVPATRRLDLAGALDADIRVGGVRGAPKFQGGFDLRDARYGGFVVPRTIGALALAGRAVELRDVDVEFERGQAFVAGSLPLQLQPLGIGPPRAPLSVDVTAQDVDLAQFAPLLPAGTKLDGAVNGRFGVEGTVDRPRLLGSLTVTNGSYASPFERAPIENVGASVSFAGSRVALRSLHADVGGGTLDAAGALTLPLGNQTGARYRASVEAKAARLDFPAYGRGTIDGKLEVAGGGAQPVVSGQVTLRDAVIPVSAVYGSGSAAGTAAARDLRWNPAFHLRAIAGDNVRVRSSIVDIGAEGAVDLSGDLRAPRLAGSFSATDGTISSYNHVFRIVNAAVSFNPADGAIPTVQARAMSRVTNPDPDPSRNIAGSANIIVTVSGTADNNNLQVTYSSDPAYSQEQIVGLLLDVPALLGAVNFNLNGGPGSPVLRGAPGETNALLPPGVTPEQVSAISFNQEVFSLLNGQFTQRALSPIERVFEKTLGLSDIQFTVDYGGGIGYSLRRQIGKRDFYAFLSQTVSYPERTNLGFELEPKPYEALNFSYYEQNGITSLITNQTPGEEFLNSTRRLTSVQPLGNRSGVSLNFNRRF